MKRNMPADPSPSHARRKALRDADVGSVMKVISTFPIEKYYSASDRLFLSFQQAFDQRLLDEAYVLGVRFAAFSLESLPRHPSYKRKHNNLRLKNAQQVDEVLQKVESLTERMDAEEKVKLQQKELERKKQQEEMQEAEKAKREKEERQMLRLQEERNQYDIESSARAKLSQLAAKMNKSDKKESKKKKLREARDEKGAERVATKNTAAESIFRQRKAKHKKEQNDIPTGDLTLIQDRRRLDEQAQELYRQHKEQEAREKRAREEQKSLKLLMQEAEDVEKVEDRQAEQLVAALLLSEEEQPVPKEENRKPTGLQAHEERTLCLLRNTITKQEARLKETEVFKIPMLLRQAKEKLKSGDRRGAAACVVRKRKLEKNVDMLKGAIFTMETQIILLESAVEDREVAKAMKAATNAMESLHVDVSDADFNDVNQAMDEISQSVVNDVMYDEEELLSELQESYPPENEQETSLLDARSMQSLPMVPTNKMPSEVEAPKRKASGVMDWF